MRCVLADAQQDPGLAVVEKVHAQEIESWKPGDATLLHRKTIFIEHRQVDTAIVKAIPRGPYHGGNTGGLEIQRGGGMPASVRADLVDWVGLGLRDIHTGPTHELVHPVLEVIRGLVRIGQILLQVWGERDAVALYTHEAA